MRAQSSSHEWSNAIPLTVIGGMQSAGKTALIRHLLAASDNRRIAAVVTDLDTLYAESSVARRNGPRLEWPNGNVAIGGDDPTSTLSDLARSTARPEHVIVEAKTESTPTRAAGYAYMPGFRPDGMISVIDAGMADGGIDTLTSTTISHLRSSDLIVLNKIDAAGARLAAETQRTVSGLASSARFLWSTHGRVAPMLVLGTTGAPRELDASSVVAAWRSDFEPARSGKRSTPVAERCNSWCLTSELGVPGHEFRQWVNKLPPTVMRGGGAVFLRECPEQRHDFWLMGKRWRLSPVSGRDMARTGTRIALVTLP